MVLQGNGVRFVDGVEGPQALHVGSRIGMLLPAHVTSGGKALLAELPDEELRALYPRGVSRGATPIGDLAGPLRACIARITVALAGRPRRPLLLGSGHTADFTTFVSRPAIRRM
ncbi:IclR family transcriptional regulator C-terminal domain-containing protein [Microbispora bryophytorum]|uniref:IclR family transcriptional regulator domain-containing protein n=1 Tax=Microbispora bryophytorum TaxID=1460882 RepID=UPI003722B4C7